MLFVSALYIYPIKSLGGIPVTSAVVTLRGFKLDRRWMIVDINNIAITQREFPGMALLQVRMMKNNLQVSLKKDPSQLVQIPLTPRTDQKASVNIFGQICDAQYVCTAVDAWFTKQLGIPCRLVYMPDTSMRSIDGKFPFNTDIVSFADEYPYLLIGQSSLDDLNKKLLEPLPMDRFRPNIVFEGGTPYQEGEMEHFTINKLDCFGVNPCARCVITTINQATAKKAKEPLKTLATYRTKNKKIYFGENVFIRGEGQINIGDKIVVDNKYKSGHLIH